MPDKFHSLSLKEAIAVEIFYSTPDDENLVGKSLNVGEWTRIKVITGITFRQNGKERDEVLEKMITEKAYKKILTQYNIPGATFRIVVYYKDEKGEIKETDLTHAIQFALSPEELPTQIIEFLTEKKEYSFLKN